jgi:hypothetical protein
MRVQCNQAYENWVKSLSVGSEVKLVRSYAGWNEEKATKIASVTPGGNFKLLTGEIIYPSGEERGRSYARIYPADGTNVERTERERALIICNRFRNYESLSSAELQTVTKIVEHYMPDHWKNDL